MNQLSLFDLFDDFGMEHTEDDFPLPEFPSLEGRFRVGDYIREGKIMYRIRTVRPDYLVAVSADGATIVRDAIHMVQE